MDLPPALPIRRLHASKQNPRRPARTLRRSRGLRGYVAPRPSSPPPTLPTPRPPRSAGPPPGSASGTASPPTSTTRARSSATTAPTRGPAPSSGRTAPSRTSAPWVGATAGHSRSTRRGRWSVSPRRRRRFACLPLAERHHAGPRRRSARISATRPALTATAGWSAIPRTQRHGDPRLPVGERPDEAAWQGWAPVTSAANGIDNQGRIVGWYGDQAVASRLPLGRRAR